MGMEAGSAVRVLGYIEKLGSHYRKILSFLYRLGGLAALFDRRLVRQYYRIEIDGERYDGNYCALHIGNGPYLGDGVCATPASLPNDGVVDVILAKTKPFVRTLFNIVRFTRGKATSDSGDFICRRAKNINISSDHPLAINLDGEVVFDTGFTVRVIPAAVKFAAVNGLPYSCRSPRRLGESL
jgi:diacylglycerol kinase family enzyme